MQVFARRRFSQRLSVSRNLRPALLLLLAGACAKNASEVTPASAAAAPKAPTSGVGSASGAPPAAKAEGSDDTTPPPGVDLSKLDEFERKVFFRVINKEPSACGKAHSLSVSLKTDRGCRKTVYAVKYVARLVDSGYTDSEISEALHKRFAGGPPKKIDVTDAPFKGNPNAPVVLVEFVDYECPHCKHVQPVMRQVVEEFKSDVKVYFKHYPLGGHVNSRLAAEGAVAAQKQGKFWPFNDKIWANADILSPALLEQFAKDIGLDVAQWRKDLESDEVKNRVQKDKTEGGVLGIESTPTIYLNGREYTDHREVESLRDWINEELGR